MPGARLLDPQTGAASVDVGLGGWGGCGFAFSPDVKWLARGCTGAHVLVQVEKYTDPLPPVRAHEPPVIARR